MVSVYGPPAAAVPAFTVNVEVPEPVRDVGLKLAVAPEGSPDTLRATAELKPSSGLTLAV
jgi:hypothetical protein